MAKYDLDASHSDPYARRTNRAAIAGLLGTLALVIGGGWLQAHPYQGGVNEASTWHATVAFNGAQYDAAGPVTSIPDDQMNRIGTTADGRAVVEPLGGGGGTGSAQRFVQMDRGLYLPVKPHVGGPTLSDLTLGGRSDPQSGRALQLPGQPPAGMLP